MKIRLGMLAMLLVWAAACAPTAAPASHPRPPATDAAAPGRAPATPAPQQVNGPLASDRYVALAQALEQEGVEIWFEADLVKAWLAGAGPFAAALRRLGDLASATHVAGFKVADEIGYDDGLESPAQAMTFLRDVRGGLARVAPGQPILIDAVVPDLGCLPRHDADGRACAKRAVARYPAASFAAIDSYLKAGLVDRLDLSTGLLDPATYAARGMTSDQAQQEAWHQVLEAGWDRLTALQSRKALAAPGGYQGDVTEADADLRLYVDLPLSAGAHAVDIWTWRQNYQGAAVGLLGPDLRSNALWDGLRTRHDRGVTLFTHMTPSTLPPSSEGVAREASVAAQVFGAVFVAAGTG